MDFEIPETVDVSAIKIVKSIGVGAKIIKATVNAAKDIADNAGDIANSANSLGDIKNDLSDTEINSADDLNDLQNSQENAVDEIEKLENSVEDTKETAKKLGEEIKTILSTPEGKETIVIALSIATTVASGTDMGDLSGAGLLAGILTMLLTVIALIALLTLTFVIPIMLIVSTISALISGLANLSTPEEVSTKIARKLPGFISLPFTMMLFQCVVPGMSYGPGIAGVCIVTILSAVLGLVISRLRSYEPAAFRYLNIVQGVSALGIVGFCVFFFNLVKTNILNSFLREEFAEYLEAVGMILTPYVKSGKTPLPEINNAFVVDLVLILIYAGFAMGSVAYLEKCVQRLACSAVANKKGVIAKDTAIVRAVLMIAVYAIPTYIMGVKHFFDNPLDVNAKEGSKSFLTLGADQMAALNMVLVGIILMLVAEIALIVLKSVFCKGMNQKAMEGIMSGAEAVADETAEAEAVAEETAEETAEVAAEEATETEAEETAEETVEEATETETEEVTQ